MDTICWRKHFIFVVHSQKMTIDTHVGFGKVKMALPNQPEECVLSIPEDNMPTLPTASPLPLLLSIDNTQSLMEVQTQLYKDMHAILVNIFGSDEMIVCHQFRVQNIVQGHFIAMRNDLHKEIRQAIVEAKCGKSWWRKLLCR